MTTHDAQRDIAAEGQRAQSALNEPTAETLAQWDREAKEVTPLPWRIERRAQWDGSEGVQIVGANDDTVADDTRYYPQAIKASDAEMTVRAVNAHAALVEALEFYARRENWQTDWDERNPCRDDMGAAARAALSVLAAID